MTPNQERLLRFVTEQVPTGQWTHCGEDALPDVLILAEAGEVEINNYQNKFRLPGMYEFKCTAEFGPRAGRTCTAESPEGAAELYAEDHVDMETESYEHGAPDSVYVDVVDATGKETKVLVEIDTTYTFKAE